MFKLFLVLCFAIAAVLLFATTRPNSFQVERSVLIQAPPEKIFDRINTLRNWAEWSPYEKMDASMKKTFSGPESGVGARQAWEGSGKAGKGSFEITQSTLPSQIQMKLDMLKPFEGHNVVNFTIVPEGSMQSVTWAMQGEQAYIAKVMGLFFNMDRMVGGQFEEGLLNLKALVEK